MTPDWPCICWLSGGGISHRWLPGRKLPEELQLATDEKMLDLRDSVAHAADGSIFVGAPRSGVTRVYGAGNEPLWESSVISRALFASARVVVALRWGDDCHVIMDVLSAGDGRRLASTDMTELFGAKLVIGAVSRGAHAGNMIVYGSGDLSMVTMYGKIVWRVQVPDVDMRAGFTACKFCIVAARGNVLHTFGMADGKHAAMPLPADGTRRRVLHAMSSTSALLGVEQAEANRPSRIKRLELYVVGQPTTVSWCLPYYSEKQYVIQLQGAANFALILCDQRCVLLVSLATAEVLEMYQLFGPAVKVWQPSLESCAEREYDRVLAAVAAVDDCAAAVDDDCAAAAVDDCAAVGLVRAVLVGFVAEDARLTARRLERAF